MIFDTFREGLARTLHRLLLRRTQEVDANSLSGSAMIFAPHPDDEVLGCGGTISAMRRAGASVKIVFMTDGALSHVDLMTPSELRRIRRAEALAAAAILGVAADDVVFLDFEDKGLSDCFDDGVSLVMELLREYAPRQVFLPHARDWHEDHATTNAIVWRALTLARDAANSAGDANSTLVYEYCVYLWKVWPFSKGAGFADGLTLRRLLGSLSLVARFATRATHCVTIDQPEQKRNALAAHRTQMEKPEEFPAWRVLSEWGGGDFLRWHFSGTEFFALRSPP
jgi:LmbE family N-acetylglucosaminyl deacetylase